MTSIYLIAALAMAAPAEDGYTSLYNGKDLTGWKNVNCAPGTFFVKGDEIITTGNPTGFLRTEKQYENFILEFEWMHVREKGMANSGLFVWGDPLPAVGTPYTRGIEVQVLLNYHPSDGWATSEGDIFSIWGAKCKPDRPHPKGLERCLPSENRTKPAGQWNHYKVIANNGSIKLHVNGKEVSGVSNCTPRKGYLALESEGSECHFRNIKIKELPSTNPSAEETAKEWEGHESIFTGLNLDGWKTEKDSWKVGGGAIKCVGQSKLETEKQFGRMELVFDWKVPANVQQMVTVEIKGRGAHQLLSRPNVKPGTWQRAVVKGVKREQTNPASIIIHPREGLELMNIFVREIKDK